MARSRSTARLRLSLALIVLLIVLVAVSHRDSFGALAGSLLGLTGLACVTVAALGRIWTSLFVAGYKDERLVREGPYSACRHPLYAFSMLAMLGLGLATRSIILAAALLVLFSSLYLWAMRSEDHYLATRHGAAFETFRREVGALWPDRSAYRVPVRYEIRPRVFWKAFVDAGSLFGAYLLIRLADLLQQYGITPTLMGLP